MGSKDTVRSKKMCEYEVSELGITIKKYHGDNSIYKSQVFIDDIDKRHHTISF